MNNFGANDFGNNGRNNNMRNMGGDRRGGGRFGGDLMLKMTIMSRMGIYNVDVKFHRLFRTVE